MCLVNECWTRERAVTAFPVVGLLLLVIKLLWCDLGGKHCPGYDIAEYAHTGVFTDNPGQLGGVRENRWS